MQERINRELLEAVFQDPTFQLGQSEYRLRLIDDKPTECLAVSLGSMVFHAEIISTKILNAATLADQLKADEKLELVRTEPVYLYQEDGQYRIKFLEDDGTQADDALAPFSFYLIADEGSQGGHADYLDGDMEDDAFAELLNDQYSFEEQQQEGSAIPDVLALLSEEEQQTVEAEQLNYA